MILEKVDQIYGGISIFKSYVFSKAGQHHRIRKIPNEDYAVGVHNDSLAAVVVCDGAGSKKAGGKAAEIVAKTLLSWIESSFVEQFFCDGETIRRRLVRIIDESLLTYSVRENMEPKELACTILLAAMDSYGRCFCVHLGDGYILRQKVDQRDNHFDIVSFPENGFSPSTTYLTLNCNMWSHIRVYRWRECDITKLILLTDGAAEHVILPELTNAWTTMISCASEKAEIEEYLDGRMPRDDFSVAIITKELDSELSKLYNK